LAFQKWEELGIPPAVFVRVANKGLTGYGKWKSAQAAEKTEDSLGAWERRNVRTSERLPRPGARREKRIPARGSGGCGAPR